MCAIMPACRPVYLLSLLLVLVWSRVGTAATTGTSLYEGSPCKLADGSRGQCIQMTKCPSALALFKKDRRNFRPKRCGFQGFVEIICCADVPLRKAEEACRDFTNEINPTINVYIYGGEVAQPGEFPHMVGTAASEFAEPFQEDLERRPLFRAPPPGPPLARQPPPGPPPPGLPPPPASLVAGGAGAAGQDPDTTPSPLASSAPAQLSNPPAGSGLEGGASAGSEIAAEPASQVDRADRNLPPQSPQDGDDPASLAGAGSADGSGDQEQDYEEVGARSGLLGTIRDKLKRHRDRLHNWHRDRVRNLHTHLFPGSPPHSGPPPGSPPPSGPPPSAPFATALPPFPAPTTPLADDYSSLIDPRSSQQQAGAAGPTPEPEGRAKESFTSFEEETTSRPRLIRVTNLTAATSEGKTGRPGNWRVPPDSIWARPPPGDSAAGAASPGAPPGVPPGVPPGASSVLQGDSEGKAGAELGGISLYVIGGDEARSDEFKHMVALGYRDGSSIKWDCGGTLISRDRVLTAAHCVTNAYRGKPVQVRLGAHNLTEPTGVERPVLEVVWHPNYTTKSHYNDIAVLKIVPVDFTERVQPACLYTRPKAPDTGMVATGWGVTDIDELDQTSDVLMKAGMDQVPLSRCNTSFAKAMNKRLARGVQPEQLCARGTNGIADTCLGDSGGPLQVLERPLGLYSIVGITSFGQLCGGLGVYVRVSAYINWIESVVWPDPS